MKSRCPQGGNDRVMTPTSLAEKIVTHFAPTGLCLEPCRGNGAFHRPLCARMECGVCSCEITEGHDFFDLSIDATLALYGQRFDWIVTNPPWSQYRRFQQHAMELADNVVFLSNLNAYFLRARIHDVEKAGFGLVEILYLDTPPASTGWPQTGFQLGCTHIRRGYSGAVKVGRLG